MRTERSWSEKDAALHKRINRLCKSSDAKCSMIATLLGSGGTLLALVQDRIDMNDLNDHEKYACALIAGNLMTFSSDNTNVDFTHFPMDNEYKIGEQAQESIFRKLRLVIKNLYKLIEDKENEDIAQGMKL